MHMYLIMWHMSSGEYGESIKAVCEVLLEP